MFFDCVCYSFFYPWYFLFFETYQENSIRISTSRPGLTMKLVEWINDTSPREHTHLHQSLYCHHNTKCEKRNICQVKSRLATHNLLIIQIQRTYHFPSLFLQFTMSTSYFFIRYFVLPVIFYLLQSLTLLQILEVISLNCLSSIWDMFCVVMFHWNLISF